MLPGGGIGHNGGLRAPGLAVLGAFILAALLAPDTDNNVTYQALPLLLFLLLVAVCWSRLSRRRSPRPACCRGSGLPAVRSTTTSVVKNLSSKAQNGLALLENLADPRPSFEDFMALERAEQKALRSFRFSDGRPHNPFKLATVKEAGVPPVAPNQEAEVRVELTPLRRGVLRFTGVTLARPDPLGLLRALTTVPLPQTVLILPRRYPVPAIALPGTAKYQEGGVALAASVGQSDEYVALRDYRHGDPLRHIHWRSWARVGQPVVKEFEDEFFVRHALVLDTFTDSRTARCSRKRCRSRHRSPAPCRTQESLLDLLFVGPQSYCFTAGRGVAHVDQMLEILAAVNEPFCEFTHAADYLSSVDGRPRYKGVETFLKSRGINIPFGDPEDEPRKETVCGLGNRKNELFNKVLEEEGVDVYDSTIKLINY